MRSLPVPGSNPFTYGESINPALRPSNAVLRSRRQASANDLRADLRHPVDTEYHDQEHHSSGEERDRCGGDIPSDIYLSDTDSSREDSDFEEDYGQRVRMRRGSEGYEVRAITSWDWMNQLEQPYETNTEAGKGTARAQE